MEHLATLYPRDVDPSAPDFDFDSFAPRKAARAIIFDEQGRVALIHVQNSGYFMLPGGGVEPGGDLQATLFREVQEEVGCGVDVVGEVGKICVYIDRWRQCQTDFCFIARKNGDALVTPILTDFEASEEFGVVWPSSVGKAIGLMDSCQPLGRDGLLVQTRDRMFLEALAKSL